LRKDEKETVKFQFNAVYAPYLNINSTVQIFFGGASSGKSYFLAQRCIKHLIEGKNYLIVRKVGLTLRDSTFNEIIKTIYRLPQRLIDKFKINESNMAITFKPNGRQIIFKGLDDVLKLKSITPRSGTFHYIWIEEATEVTEEDYNQLILRLRGVEDFENTKEIEVEKKIIIFSFNPILRSHWIANLFFSNWVDNKNEFYSEEISILKTTYRDNAFLTDDDINRLLSIKDEYYRDVYVNGKWGSLSEIIFKNWRVEDLSDRIPVFDNIRNGIDFGYSPSPFALWRSHIDLDRKIIYIIAELYIRGAQNDYLARRVKDIIGEEEVTADSESPKDIDDFKAKGIRIVPAKKGAGSVEYGIKWLQGYEIVIHYLCQNTINEFTLLRRAKDKEGNTLEKMVGARHLVDAGRYAHEIDMEVYPSYIIPKRINIRERDLGKVW